MSPARIDEMDPRKPVQRYEVLRELGDCYTSVGRYGQARRCYEEAAGLGPDEPGPYLGLGVAALQTDQLDDAEIAFRVAYRLDPGSAKACTGLALVARQRQDLSQAFDYYMKALERDPNSLVALLGLFQVSCEMGSFAQVIYYLEVYLRLHPGDPAVLFALAALYLRDGRCAAAKAILVDLLALDPAHREAAHLLEEVEHAGGRGDA